MSAFLIYIPSFSGKNFFETPYWNQTSSAVHLPTCVDIFSIRPHSCLSKRCYFNLVPWICLNWEKNWHLAFYNGYRFFLCLKDGPLGGPNSLIFYGITYQKSVDVTIWNGSPCNRYGRFWGKIICFDTLWWSVRYFTEKEKKRSAIKMIFHKDKILPDPDNPWYNSYS